MGHCFNIKAFGLVGAYIRSLEKGVGFKGVDQWIVAARGRLAIGGTFIVGIEL